MQGNRDAAPQALPLSGAGFTVYTPVWFAVLSWFGAVVMALTTLLIVIVVLRALREHEWILAGLILLFALSPSYQLARMAPALLTMHWAVEVTVEGVRVRPRKGPPRFTPWSRFGAMCDYPFAGVLYLCDLDGNQYMPYSIARRMHRC